MNKHLIYTTDDDFSLFIFKTPEEFKVYNLELQDNQSGLTYKLASYSGGRYNINPYAYEKFMKYVIMNARTNKIIQQEMNNFILESSKDNIKKYEQFKKVITIKLLKLYVRIKNLTVTT